MNRLHILIVAIIAATYIVALVSIRVRRRRAEKQFNADSLAALDKAKPGDVVWIPYEHNDNADGILIVCPCETCRS